MYSALYKTSKKQWNYLPGQSRIWLLNEHCGVRNQCPVFLLMLQYFVSVEFWTVGFRFTFFNGKVGPFASTEELLNISRECYWAMSSNHIASHSRALSYKSGALVLKRITFNWRAVSNRLHRCPFLREKAYYNRVVEKQRHLLTWAAFVRQPSHQFILICCYILYAAGFWRNVILVPKVILRYGRLKFFFFGPEKRPQRRLVGGHTWKS